MLAKGDGNWQFDHWELEDGTRLSNSNQEQGTASHTYSSTNRCPGNSTSGTHEHAEYKTEHTYYAVFREVVTQVVFAEAQPSTLGEVKYMKENAIGQEITLRTYTLDYHNKFLGWVKQGDEDNIITTDRVLTFTITDETKGTYIAKYDDGYNFVRFKNFDSGRYMDFTSDEGTLQNLTALELKPSLNDVISEAGSIIEIKEGTVRGSSGSKHTYFDYYMQNAKASKFYDFRPTDPDPTSPGGEYLRMPHDVDINVDTWALSTDDNVQSGARIGDQNGSPHIYMGKRDDADWWIEPMDKDLETCENYFSLDPAKLVQVGDDYYTTLRTSWNILFNPEQMTPYVVTAVDETTGTFEMEPLTGNIIPAGTPVVIKTKSNDVEENRMVPTTTAAASGAVPSGNLLQCSEKYFPSQTNSNNLKPLGTVDGKLAFDASKNLSKINGNEAYLPVTRNVILKPAIIETTLANIESTGKKGETYTISDELVAVYAIPDRGILWCKDQGNASIAATSIKTGQTDFMRDENLNVYNNVHNGQNGEWDQSNWVMLKFPEATSNNGITALLTGENGAVGKKIAAGTVTGRYTDDSNYTIEVLPNESNEYTLTLNGASSYTKNVYCTANFLESNTNVGENTGFEGHGKKYFFMNPKIQEVCEITYAAWDGVGDMFVKPDNTEVPGAFNVDWRYNSTGGKPTLQDNKTYRYIAVVSHPIPITLSGMLKANPSNNIIVMPLNLTGDDNIVTAIDVVPTTKAVTRVTYYNTMGVASMVPHHGINIMVIEYSDGSRSATKVLK